MARSTTSATTATSGRLRPTETAARGTGASTMTMMTSPRTKSPLTTCVLFACSRIRFDSLALYRPQGGRIFFMIEKKQIQKTDERLTRLFEAYFCARKNKKHATEVRKFHWNFEEKILELYHQLMNDTYKTLPSTCFVIKKPVYCEVFAAHFRDRIVHHYVYQYLNPIVDPKFIPHTYSCRKGKGTMGGIRAVQDMAKSVSGGFQTPAYRLKIDIRGYFMHISRPILYEKVQNMTKRSPLPDPIPKIIKQIIFNDPTKNCVRKGKRSDWDKIPKQKSLFFANANCGLPIGNLTSQLFSNIYLNDFDHFVTQKLNIKYYIRYVDDMILIHPRKEVLKTVLLQIVSYLHQIGLTLHPKKIDLQPIDKGVDVLGAYVLPHRTYIRTRNKHAFIENLKNIQMRSNDKGPHKAIATVNSYLGMLAHYQTFSLRKSGWEIILAEQKTNIKTNSLLSKIQYRMTLKEIMAIEDQKYEHEIYLFRQGTFYRGYGQSAKLFVTYIQQYKLLSNFFKVVNREICYMGFPLSQWKNIIKVEPKPFKIVKNNAKTLLLQLEAPIDAEKVNNTSIFYKQTNRQKTMKKIILTLLTIAAIYETQAQCPGLTYNGKTYQTVQIGSQCWMAENLNDTSHTAGNSSVYNETHSELSGTDISCIADKYGRLYDWEAAKNIASKISGWHLPSDDEWETLETELGGSSVAGGKMKVGGSSGFNALLAGRYSNSNETFNDLGYRGYFWSSSLYGTQPVYQYVNHHNHETYQFYSDVSNQSFVRLLKD